MQSLAKSGMRWIPGGTFHMGSDRHYPEEAPVHEVTVGGFLIDESAVTNRQFAAFVAATGYRTVAERPPNPADYPGALPEMLKPGAWYFARRAAGRSARHPQLASMETGRLLAPSGRQGQFGRRSPRSPGRPNCVRGRGGLRVLGRQGIADLGRMEVCGARRARRRRVCLG
jgi:formylglycine-generating enzyme required for sulfatase activity